ncbi:kinetochore protein Mis12/MTW1 [Rhodotorula toruloides]|uniref:Kinetochore protein Mis12/MTW1 n=1 Tax=Rhodotorula toruloides TaxID=5286 RepID=A0A511KC70_RHOTO|nr:kinetochore protein Mis12/MTW1 [Rhodotorula toruloides]
MAPTPRTDPALARMKRDLLTEHFGWAPETFAKGGMDLANRTMYTATAKVEQSLQKLVYDGVEGFNEDEVQRGIYRLETLLEDAIDTQFDLFEIFVLRNTFTFADDLLPFIALPHHERLNPDLKGADEATLAEYQEELRLYEEELQKERELACAELFVKAKSAKVQEQAELVGYLREPGKLSAHTSPGDRARILSSQLSLLQSRLSDLVTAPVPYDKLSSVPAVAPWATSRSAFINWAAAKKASPAATGAASGQAAGGEGDPVVGQFQQEADATGKADDAKALLAALAK